MLILHYGRIHVPPRGHDDRSDNQEDLLVRQRDLQERRSNVHLKLMTTFVGQFKAAYELPTVKIQINCQNINYSPMSEYALLFVAYDNHTLGFLNMKLQQKHVLNMKLHK
jgi:hypothetical protein